MNLVQNEKIKLTANWLNAMASGVVITGVVAPTIGVSLGVTSVGLPIAALSSIVWLSIGLALHIAARRVTGRLMP